PAGRVAFMQWIRTPAERRDADAIARSVAATEPLFDMLDAHLARQPFIAGERLTMADIPIAVEVHRWIGLPQPRTPRPHLDRWYDAMCARPSSRGVLDIALACRPEPARRTRLATPGACARCDGSSYNRAATVRRADRGAPLLA